MTSLRFDIVDVFTDRPFAGNPLAVVHGADDLATRSARRWRGSSTSPRRRSRATAPTARRTPTRIFTPEQEIPFAGHPTLGHRLGAPRARRCSTGDEATQHCGAGRDRGALRRRPGRAHRDAARPGRPAAARRGPRAARRLGLSRRPRRGGLGGRCRTRLRARAGHRGGAGPGPASAARPLDAYDGLAAGRDLLDGVNLYAVAGDAPPVDVHARVFVPGDGCRRTRPPARPRPARDGARRHRAAARGRRLRHPSGRRDGPPVAAVRPWRPPTGCRARAGSRAGCSRSRGGHRGPARPGLVRSGPEHPHIHRKRSPASMASVSRVRVDDEGVRARARERGRPRRALRRAPDLVVLAAPRRRAARRRRTLVRVALGAARASCTAPRSSRVVEHVSGTVVYDEEVHLGDRRTQRIAVVNDRGLPLGIDKSLRLAQTFDTRSAEHVEPLLDSIEEVLGALKKAGIDAFPAYGTLLGAVREGTADRARQRRRPRLRQRPHPPGRRGPRVVPAAAGAGRHGLPDHPLQRRRVQGRRRRGATARSAGSTCSAASSPTATCT